MEREMYQPDEDIEIHFNLDFIHDNSEIVTINELGNSKNVVTLYYSDSPTSHVELELETELREETSKLTDRMIAITNTIVTEGGQFLKETIETTTDFASGNVRQSFFLFTDRNTTIEGLDTFCECAKENQSYLDKILSDKQNELQSLLQQHQKLHDTFERRLKEALSGTVTLVMVFELRDPTQPARLSKERLQETATRLKRELNLCLMNIDNRFRCTLETTASEKGNVLKNLGDVREQLENMFLDNNVTFKEQVETTNGRSTLDENLARLEKEREQVQMTFKSFSDLKPCEFLNV